MAGLLLRGWRLMTETSHWGSLRTGRGTPHSRCGYHHHCGRRRRAPRYSEITAPVESDEMRRRSAVLVAVSALVAAVMAASVTAATAEPPPLDSVVLKAKKVGPGYTRYTMDGGRQVFGQVTLDFCGGGYPSESLRQRRFQTIYAGQAGAAEPSNDGVRGAPGG